MMAASLVVALTLPAALPAQAQSDNGALAARIERLERDLRELKAQFYRGGASGSASPSVPVGGSGDYALQRLGQIEEEVRALTGKFEEAQFANDQTNQKLDRLSNDVDFRLKTLEGGKSPAGAPVSGAGASEPSLPPVQATPSGALAPPAAAPGDPFRSPPAGIMGTMPNGPLPNSGAQALPPAAQQPQAPQAPARASALPGGTPEEQWAYAFGLVRQADYLNAEVALKEFIAQHPKIELAGNADYWLAQTYYVRGNYQAAATTFLDTVQNYGQGPKGPDAMLKLGMSLGLLNQKAEACQTLKALPSKFPKAEQRTKDQARQEAQRLKCG
jgi:tol-pal system protein YbgF